MAWTPPAGYTTRATVAGNPGSVAATKQLSGTSATPTLAFSAAFELWERVGFTVIITDAAQDVSPGGIASGEAFGTASIAAVVKPGGVATDEAFGTAMLSLSVGASSIATGEAFGTPLVDAGLRVSGISTAEAFGTPGLIIERFIAPGSITSGEAFGVAGVTIGIPQTLTPSGIGSGEVVSDLEVRLVARLVFTTPSIQETPAAWDDLNIRFGIHRGITVLKYLNGSFRSVRYPAQTELESSDVAAIYMGGRRHRIDAGEAAALTDAGYGSYITLELIE